MAQSINTRFGTTSGETVRFEVQIGNGQIASTLITLPGRQPIRRRDSFEIELGKGQNLAGKQLICSTIVTDVRQQTNRTSVTLVVTDGTTTVRESRSEEAQENGIVTYAIVVRFR